MKCISLIIQINVSYIGTSLWDVRCINNSTEGVDKRDKTNPNCSILQLEMLQFLKSNFHSCCLMQSH